MNNTFHAPRNKNDTNKNYDFRFMIESTTFRFNNNVKLFYARNFQSINYQLGYSSLAGIRVDIE